MENPKIYNLLNDYLFKNIMSKEKYLKYLLANIFGIKVNSNIKLLDKELGRKYKKEKAGIVDLLLEFDNKKYIVELQNCNKYNLEERSLYYTSKLYSSELIRNEDYEKLKVTGILILVNHDFNNNKLYDECLIKSIYDNKIFSNKIDIRIFNIKYTAKLNDLNNIKVRIAKFMINDKLAELKLLSGNDKILNEIVKEIEIYNQDKEMYQIMTLWDEKFESEQKEQKRIMEVGRQEGKKEGRTAGIKEGKKKGIKEGRKSERKLIVSNLIKNNVPLELVMKSTGLSEQEIKQIAIMN